MDELPLCNDINSIIYQMIGDDLKTIVSLGLVSKSCSNRTNTVFPGLMSAVNCFFKTTDSEYLSKSGKESVFWIDLLTHDLCQGRKTVLTWMLKYKNCPKIYTDFVGVIERMAGSGVKIGFEQYFSTTYDYEIFELYFEFTGFRVEVDERFEYKNSETKSGLLKNTKYLLRKIPFLDFSDFGTANLREFTKRPTSPILSYDKISGLVDKAVSDNNYLLLKIFELCIEKESVPKFNQLVQQLRANHVSNK